MSFTGPAEASTRVDADTSVEGTLTTARSLRVDGRVTGTIICDGVLEISDGAEVDATVEAGGIIVAGTLAGTITCRGRLEIRSTGVVRAKVDTGRLIVVEGAVYEGQLRMDAQADQAFGAPEAAASEPAEPAPAPQTGSYSFLRSFTPAPGVSRSPDDELPAPEEDDEPQ